MQVNKKRLEENLHRTGDIGRTPEGGYTRPGFSPEYKQAVRALKRMMEEAGLTVTEDRIGNVIGRREGRYPEAPVIMTGSHLDTVVNGGLFDGNLGIIAALETVHMMNDGQVETDHPIEVVAFNAEEGSEMGGTFGSRVMTGRQDLNEKGLEEKLAHYQLSVEDIKSSVRDMSLVKAFVELHIEQGAYLASEGYDIGVVDGIVGITRYQVRVSGESNHAGTTPMKLRKDPVTAAAAIIKMIHEKALEYGHPFVATVGNIEVQPGMYNVIPSEVTLYLEMRDLEQARVEQFAKELEFSAKKELSEVQVSFELQVNKPSKMLSKSVMKAIEKACIQEDGISSVVMSSGAGHDSKELIYKVPTGMIFVPSVGGISHSPKEYTTAEQIEKGVRILYRTLLFLDRQTEENEV